MKTMTRILSVVLVLCMVAALTACAPTIPTTPSTNGTTGTNGTNGTTGTNPVAPQLQFAAGTELRMATGYNSAKTGLFFDADTAKDGVKLADGITYMTGDLKPTWVEVQKRLGMKFTNQYQGNSATKEFEYWQDRLGEVDMVSGSAAQLSENGEAGKLINIAEYLDMMPNFKAYLDANPIVRLSITGNTETGAIYFSPYFDGVNDIERMPLMRTDWVEKLLNGNNDFAAESSANLKDAVYTPYMPTSGKVEIEVVKKDASGTEMITKDYDKAGNIVKVMNDALAAGTVTGEQAVNMLRKYIDEAYNGYYGENRADLFIGQNAAWDADELVALLRCVVANAKTLNGTDTIYGLFSREDANNQRRVDMMRFAGTLFGVRGLESRQDYLYVGTDGKLHDARQDEATYLAMERMNAMAQEGLISASFMAGNDDKAKTDSMLEKDLGFMHYDYNQTQTIYNETKLDSAAGEKYMAVMVPVARWNDGTEKFMRFTESWRSVKTDGWAISKEGVKGSQDKLYAALKLIDYAYSEEGQILMSYGPDAFIKMENGKYVTFNFNGKEMPVIADATYEELWAKASGNYTNYARQYLGSTLSFVKSQAFEYQCTHTVGKEGAGYISNAIALGTIKHPELAITENPWYISIPTVLPNTVTENEAINKLTELKDNFSTSKGKVNNLIDMIVKGYAAFDGVNSAADAAKLVAETWSGKVYLDYKNIAYQALLDYYAELSN